MAFVSSDLSDYLQFSMPIWQAPLPFEIISAEFSGQISDTGGVGIIRVGEGETAANLEEKLQKYSKKHKNPAVCFTHRLPHYSEFKKSNSQHFEQLARQYSIESIANGDNFLDLLDTALGFSPRLVGFANGIPDRDVLSFIRNSGALTFAICHSLMEALTAEEYGISCVVLQGTEAGGEQFHFANNLPVERQSGLILLQQLRQLSNMPIILWSPIAHGADIVSAIILGAQAVMVDRVFVRAAISESARKYLDSKTEYDLRCDTQYTARKMRYIPAENATVLHLPDISSIEREIIASEYLRANPEQIPYPVCANSSNLPTKLPELFATLSQQAGEILQR